MHHHRGFSLTELMIAIAIMAILAGIGIPTYQNYTQRARYSEVVNAAIPYKIGVNLCFQLQGDLSSCNGGAENIPKNIAHNEYPGLVDTAEVKSGVITLTPKTLYGFKNTDRLVFTPTVHGEYLSWATSGDAVQKGWAS